MHIEQLEKAVRAVAKGNAAQPALLALGGDGSANVPIREEFAEAARTLAGRSRLPVGRSILHGLKAEWS